MPAHPLFGSDGVIGNLREYVPLAIEDQRRIRCMKTVDHLGWNGSTTIEELCAALSGLSSLADPSSELVAQDIALLQHEGLPIVRDTADRWRIDATMPGFRLRLQRAEASAVWARCFAHSGLDGPSEPRIFSRELLAAVATLLSGLRMFQAGSEVMQDSVAGGSRLPLRFVTEPAKPLQVSRLIGEARLVYRRMRIVDLIESRNALDTGQIAAVLSMSHRTVHDDLNVLRHCGVGITFRRYCNQYQIAGLNSYLADHLTLPMAAALLVLFEPSNARHDFVADALPSSMGPKKLIESIRLIFASQAADLQELATNFRTSEAPT